MGVETMKPPGLEETHMHKLNEITKTRVDNLLKQLDFPSQYRDYVWKSDNWDDGFPDIFNLEKEIGKAARAGAITRNHLVAVAKWGGLPNVGRIKIHEPLRFMIFEGDKVASWVKNFPENVIRILEGQIQGFGPTYTSKLLRFASPETFGAIDTRIVRVFGKGAHGKNPNQIIDLNATPIDGRWAILSSQAAWPREYATWIAILAYIGERLNESEICCPHPRIFIDEGLRVEGEWLRADVEMALFYYASTILSRMGG